MNNSFSIRYSTTKKLWSNGWGEIFLKSSGGGEARSLADDDEVPRHAPLISGGGVIDRIRLPGAKYRYFALMNFFKLLSHSVE